MSGKDQVVAAVMDHLLVDIVHNTSNSIDGSDDTINSPLNAPRLQCGRLYGGGGSVVVPVVLVAVPLPHW